MKNSLNTRLLSAFGAMILMIAIGAAVAGWFTWKAAGDYHSLHMKTAGTAELATAESGLWQLRYAISQATSADEAGIRKYSDAEANIYKTIWNALDAYQKTEINAIKRVTDIVGEISAASGEQNRGMEQIGDAVHQMYESTQQNAALVEQSAAAADSLKTQAEQLVQAVAVFKLKEESAANAQVLKMPRARHSAPSTLSSGNKQIRATESAY